MIKVNVRKEFKEAGTGKHELFIEKTVRLFGIRIYQHMYTEWTPDEAKPRIEGFASMGVNLIEVNKQ